MTTVRCIVGTGLLIPKTIPDIVLKKILVKLTYPNPSYLKNKNGKNNICYARDYRNYLYVPRGTIGAVTKIAKEHNLVIELKHSTSYETFRIDYSGVFQKLRQYQKSCVRKMIKQQQGYICIPCGGGKTFMGAVAMVISKQRGIVVVHTKDLVKQWCETFRSLGHKKLRRLVLYNRKIRPLDEGEICVATVQKLSRAIDRGEAKDFMSSSGAIIMDEAHHCPADMFQKVFHSSSALYRWGMTATPQRPDGFGFVLPMMLGKRIFSMKVSDLVGGGFLMSPKIVPVLLRPTNKTTSKKVDIMSKVSSLSMNTDRNFVLSMLAIKAAYRNRKSLMLVPRVSQAKALDIFLKSKGIRSVYVTGDRRPKEREMVMAKFRKGHYDIIIATQLADEGLDLPILDTLIQTSAGKSSGKAIQRVGRVMRKYNGKKQPLVLEIVDDYPVFRRQWDARRVAYLDAFGINCEKMTLPCGSYKYF